MRFSPRIRTHCSTPPSLNFSISAMEFGVEIDGVRATHAARTENNTSVAKTAGFSPNFPLILFISVILPGFCRFLIIAQFSQSVAIGETDHPG